jgi:hypothetical protein
MPASVTPTTDERLRSYLDTNQLAREQLAADILALDRRFSGVKPRHPRGGRDGGVDIEAQFDGQPAAIAVGFVNGATDADAERKQIKTKYKEDASSAANRTPRPGAFFFFTNTNLSLSEKSVLQAHSTNAGIASSEIFDRDRMRVILDGPDGLGIRYRYLQIPLSDAEQAAFFSRWGDDIQKVIGSRFSNVESSLARIQFLHEAASPLDQFTITAELDREYLATEIGHFRLVCSLYLAEPKPEILGLSFGATDNSGRQEAKRVKDIDQGKGGIGRSMCGGAWVAGTQSRTNRKNARSKRRSHDRDAHWSLSSFTSVGREKVRLLPISFGFGGFFRVPPYLMLRDMDGCTFALFANRSLAEKLKTIHVSGNEYKLAEFSSERIRIDEPNSLAYFPYRFTRQELSDPWVRIMSGASPFGLSFSDFTPLRMYAPEIVSDSLFEMRRKQLEEYKRYRREML